MAIAESARKSQAKEGVSLSAQRERLKAYGVAHGFEVLAIEKRAGISRNVAPTKRQAWLAL